MLLDVAERLSREGPQLLAPAMDALALIAVERSVVVNHLGIDVLPIEQWGAQLLQSVRHRPGDRANLLHPLYAVLLGDPCKPVVRAPVIVEHASRELADLLIFGLVGSQLAELD